MQYKIITNYDPVFIPEVPDDLRREYPYVIPFFRSLFPFRIEIENTCKENFKNIVGPSVEHFMCALGLTKDDYVIFGKSGDSVKTYIATKKPVFKDNSYVRHDNRFIIAQAIAWVLWLKDYPEFWLSTVFLL